MTTYRDRADAGRDLAERLTDLAGRPDVIVLGLVRGGVPVARVVADRLGAPLDVLVVRKLGVPWAPEVAFGALGPGGVQVLNDAVAGRLSQDDRRRGQRREQAELDRREQRYRAGRPPLDLTGRTAVIVDDGLATGATARAAVQVARHLGAARVRRRRAGRRPAGVRDARRRGRRGGLRPAPARLRRGERLLRRLPRGLRRRGRRRR